MSTDLRDGTVHAWPTTAPTWRQRLTGWIGLDSKPTTGGKHRPDNIRPVDPGHLLTPAALQLATLHTHTAKAYRYGIWAPRDINPTGAWTQPAGVATNDEITQWAAGGADIDDQATKGAER
ncbi:hypothetical protein AB0J14_38580 [Micromonospora arborensis]|uniref:hypothetical protein n=1 Tax=Micromonospora arborensis TaxID=2116518 RepID=UPI0033D0B45B